jgi:FkbM family methyltransferase
MKPQKGTKDFSKQVARKILPEKTYRLLADKLRGGPPEDMTAALRHAIENQMLSDASLLEIRNAINIKRRMDYAPHDIYLHVDSATELQTRLRSCAKEPDTVEWIESMKPGDTFYDIGANVGAYTLIAAKAFGGRVTVFAFEPAFLNFTQLCRNVALNQCQDSVTPLSIALSNKTSLDSFNYHDLITGSALHTLGEAIDYKGDRFEPVLKQSVLSFKTDDLIAQFDLPKPTHIKIDVDGIEFLVLKGADQTLSDGTLRSIVVELEAGEGEQQITDYLMQKGFRLDARHGRQTPGMFNCIFVRA